MVHYGHGWQVAQLPPPICPKCGSHRTQVVGRSNDARSVIVRCNACGERSTVALVDVGAQLAPDETSDFFYDGAEVA
jgi:hypothetical protein